MRQIVMLSFISLDGVMQAPGAPEEDTSEGFKYGGWTVPLSDEFSGKLMGKQISMPFDLLLGRKTYDMWAAFWPKQEGDIADAFRKATKYVVSHGQPELSWDNSVLINDDAVSQIQELKQQDGPMLQVQGSGNLIQSLLQNNLVDELWLKTYPVILGSGKRLFAEGIAPATFELTESQVSPNGVIFANYKRVGEVKIGSFS